MTAQISGEILFNGGWIPLYGCILTYIETRKTEDVISKANGLALLFIIIAIIMFKGDPEDGWAAVIGMPILETAVIYMIMKFLFIKEGDAL